MDYSSMSITAIFPIGTNSTTINIPLTVDNTVEEMESFNLNFTILTLLNGRVTPGTIITATGIIIDDTSKRCKFIGT